MKYTVCFLYADNGERVLLQRKDKTQYSGRLNGVGGKIELGETPLEGARREIMEETGANIQDLIWLGTLILPKDCGLPAGQDNVDCELNYFAGTVEDTKMVSQQPGETEPLLWLFTRQVIGGHITTAGDGDVEYFVSKGFQAVTARIPEPENRKKLDPDLAERYRAIADNLACEAKFLRYSAFHAHPSMTDAMNDAVTVIRSLATNGFDNDLVTHYKTVARSLADKKEDFERNAIKSCVSRYAFSPTAKAMDRAVAAIEELIRLNT